MTKLLGKKAVIAGGSRGIGKSVCIEMARAGADVALAYNKSDASALEVVAEIEAMGRRAFAIRSDFSAPCDTTAFVEKSVEALGGIDILVYCAGIFRQALVTQITNDDWYEMMRVNLDGAFFASRAAVPHMRESGAGRIIFMSSQAALAGTAHGAHYGASKAGLLGMTYSLSKELGPDNITVNAILPGRVETDILSYASEDRRREWIKSTPMGFIGEPFDIAYAAVFLASDEARYITGAKLNINGGLLPG